jgi:uncharacterized protein (DUF58 family)
VKKFVEERDQTVMFVVDASHSLDFGTVRRMKGEIAAEIAAVLAFSAIRNNDKVGLIGFTDRVEVFVPPRSGRKHVLAVVQRVLTHEPEHRGTRPAAALEYFARLGRSHSVVALISDFVEDHAAGGDEAAFERALKLVRRRNEIIPVRVEDPIELELPPLGLVAVEDLELLGLGGDRFVDLTRARAQRYRDTVAAERERFDKLMRRLRLETASIRCGESWQQPLVRFFERRARRMRR